MSRHESCTLICITVPGLQWAFSAWKQLIHLSEEQLKSWLPFPALPIKVCFLICLQLVWQGWSCPWAEWEFCRISRAGRGVRGAEVMAQTPRAPALAQGCVPGSYSLGTSCTCLWCLIRQSNRTRSGLKTCQFTQKHKPQPEQDALELQAWLWIDPFSAIWPFPSSGAREIAKSAF